MNVTIKDNFAWHLHGVPPYNLGNHGLVVVADNTDLTSGGALCHWLVKNHPNIYWFPSHNNKAHRPLPSSKIGCPSHYDVLEIFRNTPENVLWGARKVFRTLTLDYFAQLTESSLRRFLQCDGIVTLAPDAEECLSNAIIPSSLADLKLPPVYCIPPRIKSKVPKQLAKLDKLDIEFSTIGDIRKPLDNWFTFVWIGHTMYRKGLDILIKSFYTAFRGRLDQAALLIVATDSIYGDHISALKQGVPYINLPDCPPIFIVRGPLPEATYQSLLTAPNAAYVSTHRYEGFGLPIFQAAANNLPVLASTSGGSDSFLTLTQRLSTGTKVCVAENDFCLYGLELNYVEVAVEMQNVFHRPDLYQSKPESITPRVFASRVFKQLCGAPHKLPTHDNKPGVSVIIATHTIDNLATAIASCEKVLDSIAHEIIVVFNGHADKARVLAIVGKHVWFFTAMPIGMSNARNIGIRFAKYDSLLFMDGDATLEAFDRVLMCEPRTIYAGLITCPFQQDAALSEVWAAGANFDKLYQPIHRLAGKSPSDPVTQVSVEVAYGPGCALLIPYQVLQQLNGFDSARFHCYFEDADVCYQARQSLKVPTIYTHVFRVAHKPGSAHRLPGFDVQAAYNRSRTFFIEKYSMP